MDKDKKKYNTQKKKKPQQTEDQNILQEVLKLIEYLFEARLIERIARPIDKKVREDLIEKYGVKLEQLHEKLKKIRTQIVQMAYSQNGNARNKSVFGEATNKPTDFKKIIRNIESKYIEILVDGSFKHFKKIAYALGLNYTRNMYPINIEEWAAGCLDAKHSEHCC